MKSIKPFILAAVLTATAATVGCSDTKSNSSPQSETVEQTISPESISFEWQKSFQDKLDEFKGSDGFSSDSAFDLFDMTGDGNPELIISQGTDKTSACEIYTYTNGALTLVGTAGFEGTFEFLPEFGLTREEYRGDGFLIGKFKQIDHGELTNFLTYRDNSDSASEGVTIKHEINGEDMLLRDYEAALIQYVDTLKMHLGRKYTFGDDSLNYAIRRAESWGGVLGSKRKAVCRKKLSEIAAEIGNDNRDAAFELCDLNGDDTPEIIVSTGSAPESTCRIYYFSGDELEQLEGEYGRYGRLFFDIGSLVFYNESETGFTYWSLADSEFTADKYKSSGSIMEAGRRFALTSTGIDSSMV